MRRINKVYGYIGPMRRKIYWIYLLLFSLPLLLQRHQFQSWKPKNDVNTKVNSIKSWPFQRFDNVTDSKNRLTILIANCPYIDFLDNILESMKTVGVNNIVVVPMDKKAYDYAIQLLSPDNVAPVPESLIGITDWHEAAVFRTQQFKNLTSSRAIIIEQFLNMGYTVFYCDIDVFWKRNIYEMFDSEDEADNELDFIAAKDTYKKFHMCTCYLYLHPTQHTKYFIQQWKNESSKQKYICDQDAAGSVLKQNLFLNGTNFKLISHDSVYLPSGRAYKLSSPEQRAKIWMIHNNFINGREKKKNRFKDEWDAWKPSRKFDTLNWTCS